MGKMDDVLHRYLEDAFEQFFADYPMGLYCVNENSDLSVFHT